MTDDKEKKTAAKRRPGQTLRRKINMSVLISALEEHVLGKRDMTESQIKAAIALLRKAMPGQSTPVRKMLKKTTVSKKEHEDALKELE